MNSKLHLTACAVAVICSLGATNNQIAVAQPSSCRTAFAFDTNNSFGDCSPSTSLLIGENQPSQLAMAAFTHKTALKMGIVVAQYNSNFAVNYAQWKEERQWVAVQNQLKEVQLATALTNIQCRTSDGPATYLCYQ